jgi:hypothetical protein
MMTKENTPEEETKENDDEQEASMTTEAWEAQLNIYGETLPTTIPDFYVVLAKFIIKQAGVKVSFPATLRREGGIRAYEQFVRMLSYSCSKRIEVLGGKVSITNKKDIVHCIALALLPKTPDDVVLGTDLVLQEYTYFKQGLPTNSASNSAHTHRTKETQGRKMQRHVVWYMHFS